jgi:hypothetical protein
MIDTTTPAATVGEPVIKTVNGIILEQGLFKKGTKNEGFSYWFKQFSTLDSAKSHFANLSKVGKDGESVLLAIVNSALAFRMRNIATTNLLEDGEDISDAKRNELLSTAEGSILISETEALEYIPGERETTSVNGLTKQANDLKKAIVKAKNDGNMDLARTHYKKWAEVKNTLDSLIEEQKKKDAESMAEFAELPE